VRHKTLRDISKLRERGNPITITRKRRNKEFLKSRIENEKKKVRTILGMGNDKNENELKFKKKKGKRK
jgi:hypothetical protein